MVIKQNYYLMIQFNLRNWDRGCVDNGDYSEQSPYFDITNKKFRDKAGSIPINEFVGQRSIFFLRKIVKKAAKQQKNQKEYQTCRL